MPPPPQTPLEKVDSPVDKAKGFYDNQKAYTFYKELWGGDHIHVGLYDEALKAKHPNVTTEYIREASHKSLDKFIHLLPASLLNAGTAKDKPRFMDMGSGYGGCARALATKYNCHVTCIDISSKESEHNRALTRTAGLDHMITVKEASFTATKEPSESYDVVYSIDAFMHAGMFREAAFTEASRVLKGQGQGYFLLADPMQADVVAGEAQQESLRRIYERIQLDSMGSHASYCALAEANGFELVHYVPMTDMLIAHYEAIKHLLEERKGAPEYEGFVEDMITGLERWVKGGHDGTLNYGYFVFRKK